MQTTSTPAPPRAAASPVRRFVGRNMYRWHRTLGLVTLLPVIMWTLSGLSHPLMSNWLRPAIAHETVPTPPLAAGQLAVPVAQVLSQNHLAAIQNLRVVQFQQQPYYQLTDYRGRLRYFSAATGRRPHLRRGRGPLPAGRLHLGRGWGCAPDALHG